MTAEERAKLINSLREVEETAGGETEGRWEAMLPTDAGTFHGHRVGLWVDTEVPVWKDRSLLPDEVALLTLILQNLPSLLSQAEQVFDQYSSGIKDARSHVEQAFVHLDRTEQQEEGRDHWAFFVSFRDSDSTFAVNFDGLQLNDYWGGD